MRVGIIGGGTIARLFLQHIGAGDLGATQVVSVVGRNLEHSRIIYFNNGGAEEMYLSSADWLPAMSSPFYSLLSGLR